VKVAICNPVFWPEVRRGSERFAYELAAALMARGHTARIVAGHRGRVADRVEQGVPVTLVPDPATLTRPLPREGLLIILRA